MTSSSLFLAKQSRIPCRVIPMRLSRASKCGSQSTGATGSLARDSRISWDRGLGPLWNLGGWNEGRVITSGRYLASLSCTHLRSTSRVEARIRQHCSTGARMESSSWKGFPKPRPWSKCSGNVSFPKILRMVEERKCHVKAPFHPVDNLNPLSMW